MDENEVKAKLDQYAEFLAQRDAIELNKRELLDDVKIPEDVQAIVTSGAQRMAGVEREFAPLFDEINAETNAQLAEIVVPDEIKAALAAIDASRRAVNEKAAERRAQLQSQIQRRKAELQAEIEAQTRDVYTAIATRKAEIEAEFGGATQAVSENIRKLEAEIKSAVKEIGFTIRGKYYRAEYGKGRKSWDAKRLEVYESKHPEIKDCYTIGEPSVAIKAVK